MGLHPCLRIQKSIGHWLVIGSYPRPLQGPAPVWWTLLKVRDNASGGALGPQLYSDDNNDTEQVYECYATLGDGGRAVLLS